MKKYTLLVPLLVLITTGCTQFAHIHAPQPKWAQVRASSANPEELEALMAFMIQLNHSVPDDQVKEYNALRAIPEKGRGDEKLLELSLLLSQPGFPMRNDTTALQMLQAREQQSADKDKDSGLMPLIHWLRTTLQERARLVGGATECSDQLHDEKKRADACNDKLQAIRKMEDSLIERNRH